VPNTQITVGANGSSTASDIVFATNVVNATGTERMRVTSNGNVGIGTSTPTGLLSINPNGITGPAFVVGSSTATNFAILNTGQARFQLGSAAAPSVTFPLAVNGLTTGFYGVSTDNGGIRFSGAGTDTLRLNSSGMQVYSSGVVGFGALAGTSDVAISRGAAGKLYVGTGGTGNSDGTLVAGNIGIGTTSPSSKLTVAGDILGAGLTATGTVTFSGLTGGVLTTNGSGVVSASTTIGTAYLDSSVLLSSEVDTSAELAALLSDETGTAGSVVFSASPTLSGLLTFANASGTALTTSGNAYFGGNVGIGTTTPNNKLTVTTSGATSYLNNGTYSLVLNNSLNPAASLSLQYDGSNDVGVIQTGVAGVGFIKNLALNPGGGNVGIGTTTPNVPLEVLRSSGAGYTWTPNTRTTALFQSGNAAGATISIVSKSTGYSGIYFGDDSLETQGQLKFDNADNHFGFTTTGGTEQLTLLTSGNLGIGTTTPNVRLSVLGSATRYNNNSTYAAELGTSDNSARKLLLGYDSQIDAAIVQAVNLGVSFDKPLLLNPNNGNVGIGTTSPAYKLDVNGNVMVEGTNHLSLNTSSNYFNADSSGIILNNNLIFRLNTNGSTALYANFNGNIGIGTTSPSSKLTVAGDILGAGLTATGTVTFSGLTGGVLTTNGSGVVSASTTIGAGYLDSSVLLSSEVDTSAELAALLSDETGTAGNAVFSTNPLLAGFRSSASSTIGDGTATGGLTISGGATTTGNTIIGGDLGLSGNSINSAYSINAAKGAYFGNTTIVGGDLSATRFLDYANSNYLLDPDNTGTSLAVAGNVGIGTTTPSRMLTVTGDALFGTTTASGTLSVIDGWSSISTGHITVGSGTTLATAPTLTFAAVATSGPANWTGSTKFSYNDSGFYISHDYGSGPGLAPGGFGLGTGGRTDDIFIGTSGNVGIGTTSPNFKLEVGYSGTTNNTIAVSNYDTGATSYAEVLARNAGAGSAQASGVRMVALGTGWTTSGGFVQNGAALDADTGLSGGLSLMARASGAAMRFYTGGSADADERMRIDGNGNVGIGTTTPSSLLTVGTTSYSGSGVAGLKESYSFTNSVASAVYYGNEMYIVNNPSATSTLVGKMIRIEDDSALGNTVRGLEVQTHRGTNTKGENTA
ncbi:MAG TPA: hypothetical protein VFS75_02515, partial [Candidatus Paceibacterota bacterium]|nr:hypothetical protein [Candidatus Paceibacterota bacterium]